VRAIAADRAAQPLVVNVADDSAPDEDAGTITQAEIPVVKAAAAAAQAGPASAAAAFDEDGPVWPDEAAESAMRVEVQAQDEPLTLRGAREAAAMAEVADAKTLPALDTLVARVPEGVRATLEDLFRAKFVRVTRASLHALKT
jgi:hypothetical protein